MDKIIRIGTRSSELALWQANSVAKQLDGLGYKSEIVKIDSIGDIVLDKPLYELGVTGVFTKNLDIALRMVGIQLDVNIIDKVIDLVELIENKGDDVTIKDIVSLQQTWSRHSQAFH